MITRPICWTIAGTDPTAGAGIQADLKTMQGLGAYGCTVITAILAQNTQGVRRVECLEPGWVAAQIEALAADTPPQAVKIGMLGRRATVEIVARYLQQNPVFAVCDPVLHASSGADLLEPAAWPPMIRDLFPRLALATPNIPEAQQLTGLRIVDPAGMEAAATRLLELGAPSVLIKGGHAGADTAALDFWTDGHDRFWLNSPRQAQPHTHGAGCTFSSAVAAAAALGLPLADALVVAKAYVNQGLRLGGGIGRGRGPLAHEGWPATPADLPWITPQPHSRPAPPFPACGPAPLGLYALVDSAARLEPLLAAGLRTAQLRIKPATGANIEREIQAAIRRARDCGCRLFINDYWELAIRYGAYGVHLGQQDLAGADLAAIRAAGLRLGVSTHSFSELARAAALRPSYIAIGTVFPSPSKPDLPRTLGAEGFRRLAALAPAPVVAIGGLHVENAAGIIAAGADGIAVISDLARAADPGARVRAWQQLWPL